VISAFLYKYKQKWLFNTLNLKSEILSWRKKDHLHFGLNWFYFTGGLILFTFF